MLQYLKYLADKVVDISSLSRSQYMFEIATCFLTLIFHKVV